MGEDAAQSKGEFVAQVAHDLRTPITVVRWYTEMLLAGKAGAVNEKQVEYLNFIHAAALKMEENIVALREKSI